MLSMIHFFLETIQHRIVHIRQTYVASGLFREFD